MTNREFAIRSASGLIIVALLVFAPSGSAAAAPCFTAVDAEPLGRVADDALVLHAGWRMRESAIAGVDGAAFSQPGFRDADWYETSVPATALGVLVRHGVYPDPYVGVSNLRIPDASDAHNRRYHLDRFSHLPDHSNPWSKPYWFRKEFSLPARIAAEWSGCTWTGSTIGPTCGSTAGRLPMQNPLSACFSGSASMSRSSSAPRAQRAGRVHPSAGFSRQPGPRAA